jgi:RNA polymerase sigma-70 factor, ECF subfamily
VRPKGVVARVQSWVREGGQSEVKAASGARPSDAVLVAAARGGDRWAQEALFRRHAPLAMGLAYRLLGSDADLEDVVQEAQFLAFSRLDRLREPQAFASWLAGTVVRRVRQLLRHRRMLVRLGLRTASPVDADLAIAPDTPPDVAAELASIYAVVDALSTQARLALLLRRVDGYSLQEIAAMLECSLSTVKRRLAEAERALLVHQQENA